MSEAGKTQNRLGGIWLAALGAVLLVLFVTASQAGWSRDRVGFESFLLLWPLTYIGAVVMWFYVYGKARVWWYCYHMVLLAVCSAHLAIVVTGVREWSLLMVQSWRLGGCALFSIGILPLTLLIVSAPLLRSRVLQKRRAGTTLPADAQLPA